MITGFCAAINPIDFTIWTSIVLLIGMMIGILLSSLFRFFTSYTFDGRSNLQNLLLAKESSQHHYPMEMDHICYDKIRRRSPDKEQWYILYFIVMDQIPKIWVLYFGSAMEKWVFKGKLNKIFAIIEGNLPKTLWK